MSHVPTTHLHGYKSRAMDLSVDVETDAEPGDLSSIIFRIGDAFDKTGLTAEQGAVGQLLINFTLTVADMNLTVGVYRWECVATVAGQQRSLAQGRFTISEEPTV